jgi:predicted ATPase
MKTYKRLAIVGAQNCGKTTLIEYFLSKVDSTWIRSSSNYRDVIKVRNLPINQKATANTQFTILKYMSNDLISHIDDKKNIIFDRSVIDVICYTQWLLDNNAQDINRHIFYSIRNACENLVNFYTHIYFIPFQPGIPIEDDNLRDTSTEYITNINSNFISYFTNSRDPIYYLKVCNSNVLEKRFNELSNFIEY